MLISRRVNDPTAPFQPNKLKRTTGVYGHLPKFWSCKDFNFNSYLEVHQKDRTLTLPSGKTFVIPARRFPDEFVRTLQENAEAQKIAHRGCKHRHVSYHGYLVLVTKKCRYTWWYMGNPYGKGNLTSTVKSKFEHS